MNLQKDFEKAEQEIERQQKEIVSLKEKIHNMDMQLSAKEDFLKRQLKSFACPKTNFLERKNDEKQKEN